MVRGDAPGCGGYPPPGCRACRIICAAAAAAAAAPPPFLGSAPESSSASVGMASGVPRGYPVGDTEGGPSKICASCVAVTPNLESSSSSSSHSAACLFSRLQNIAFTASWSTRTRPSVATWNRTRKNGSTLAFSYQ